MKTHWLAAIPVSLTFLLVFIIIMPAVQSQGRTLTECSPTRCVTVVQFESISHAFGGWGAVFQTGVNWYYVGGWVCNCPANATECCVAPFASIVWTVVGILFLVDLLSIVVITQKSKEK